ncbi:MAG: Fic family protein [Phycisphaerales bacterium]|nr:Fic family protein [Phycisphaerales bacterium]
MIWNWQHPNWPEFEYDPRLLARAEQRYLLESGAALGVLEHLDADGRLRVIVEALSLEALSSSHIEGEMLRRESVQSSVRRAMGLASEDARATPAERGVAELMVAVHRDFAPELSRNELCGWHAMVMSGRDERMRVGAYRTGDEPMQIVSGRLDEPEVVFEAPPSTRVTAEMDRLIDWFNRTAPGRPEALPVLTRAGLAHLWFESVHPFEDGNGRVGRALIDKALHQGLGRATLTGVSATVLRRRGEYYAALRRASRGTQAAGWLRWFAGASLEARAWTRAQVSFVVGRATLLSRSADRLNTRQRRALDRVLATGVEGFFGGLSASKYAAITKASTATSTRDLAEMVELGVLRRTGQKRGTRYWPVIDARAPGRITIGEDGAVVEEPPATPQPLA